MLLILYFDKSSTSLSSIFKSKFKSPLNAVSFGALILNIILLPSFTPELIVILFWLLPPSDILNNSLLTKPLNLASLFINTPCTKVTPIVPSLVPSGIMTSALYFPLASLFNVTVDLEANVPSKIIGVCVAIASGFIPPCSNRFSG